MTEPFSARARGVSCVPPRTVGELATEHGGRADEEAVAISIAHIAPVASAGPDDLAPIVHRRYLRVAGESPAVLLVDEQLAGLIRPGRRWIHPEATLALARVLAQQRRPFERARVDPTAVIGAGAVILEGAVIGPEVHIEPNAVIYGGVEIRARARIGAGSVVGREGFGFTPGSDGALVRIPQLGGVTIGEDAELGPLCTVDAGTLTPTVIEPGVKLDAQVHVGHNAIIGEGSLVAAQSGFAGSVRIGRRCQVGGQAGVADHVRVGHGARLAAKSGVIGDVLPGEVVAGYPAVPRARWLRATAETLRARPNMRRGSRKDGDS